MYSFFYVSSIIALLSNGFSVKLPIHRVFKRLLVKQNH